MTPRFFENPRRPTASPQRCVARREKGGRGGYCREERRHDPKRLVICDGPDVRTVVDGRYHAVVKLRLSEKLPVPTTFTPPKRS